MPRVIVAIYDALGGPPSTVPDPRMDWDPTVPGTWVFGGCWRHSSSDPSSPWRKWSHIRWGSRLRVNAAGEVEVEHEGSWEALSDLTTATRAEIEARNDLLYGDPSVPSTWVFNDFGHISCFKFLDVNGNRKRDGDETFHDDILHTTPLDEALVARGLDPSLGPSHGCVHIGPDDIDEMIDKGYAKSGNLFVIHSWSDRFTASPGDPTAGGPYEVHFFPNIGKIIVYGHN